MVDEIIKGGQVIVIAKLEEANLILSCYIVPISVMPENVYAIKQFDVTVKDGGFTELKVTHVGLLVYE